MRKFLAAELRKVEEPKNVEAMIDGHDHHIATAGQVGPGSTQRIGRSIGEGAAMEPHHDGALARIEARGPQVQCQAIFADRHLVRYPGQSGYFRPSLPVKSLRR